MIAWTLWWDYHQTFTDPLRLFDANVFYPYKYTLAFSENDYGLSLLFFPLFALGVKALTVNAIATFLGFALIWHIWWLAAASFLGAYATFVVFAWRDRTEYRIPAEEVARIDRENRSARRAALAQLGAAQ